MLLGLCVTIANLSVAMIEPLLPLYLEGLFGIGKSQAGLIFGIQALGYLVTTPLAVMVSKIPCEL